MNGLLVNPENTLPVGGQQYIGLEANVLQGFLFDKRRADVLKARFYEAYYNAEEKLQINDLLHAATTTYAEYLLSSKVNALYNEFGMLAQKRLTAIYEMTAIGEKPYMDTLEASILLQSRRLDLQSSELELLKKKNEIDYVFLVESTDKQVAVTLTDSIEGVFSKMKNKLNECMNEVENNPILAKYNTQQRILETEKRLKREMIKPALSINYNFLSKDYSGLTPDVNWNNYKWGANFSFPLFVRKSRNELKMANVLVHTNSMELVNKRNELLNKRQSTIAGIDIIIKQIQFAERSVEYSKLLLEMESMKFNNGESSLFLLNSRESKLLESEVKLNEYKLKYIRMVLDLIYLNGNLNYSI